MLGAKHPDSRTSRNNLANAYQTAGPARTSQRDGSTGRSPLYEQTLSDRERVLGAEHPDTPDLRGCSNAVPSSLGQFDRLDRSRCPTWL